MDTQAIQDIYPLSPMQEGMLFHTLADPESAAYRAQLSTELRGDLDLAAFRAAWQDVLDRHPVLRSVFDWEELDRPVQLVMREVSLPFEVEDWSDLEPADQATRLAAMINSDRQLAFDLAKAPLMRLRLVRLDPDRHHFVWSHHHLLLDGWSLALVLDEVWTLYRAFGRGQASPLPPARPFRDYIGWLQAQDLDRAEAFWRAQLAGLDQPSTLGLERPVAGSVSHAKVETTWHGDELAGFARRGGWTFSTLVQGAWALLLHHYSGEREVVFGTTVSGRPAALSGVESIIGLFINTLPVRCFIDPATKLGAWLHELQHRQLEAQEYAYTPLARIQGWSDVQGGEPLLSTNLVFEAGRGGDDAEDEAEAGLEIAHESFDVATEFPVSLEMVDGAEPHFSLVYRTDQLAADQARQVLGHTLKLLARMVASPDAQLGELSPLDAADRRELAHTFNGTDRDYGPSVCLQQLIEEQVDRTPQLPAVVFEDRQLTYAELDRQANQLANYLIALGVGPDARVAVCLERSLELVVSLVAVLKAGGAYVPIDPEYPRARQAFMLADSDATILLSVETLTATLPLEAVERTVLLDRSRAEIAALSEVRPVVSSSPQSLAYVIYTSGSTGRPKGAMNSHRAIVNRLRWMQEAFVLDTDDTVLQKTPYSFDVSVWEFFWPLVTGARLVVAKPGGHREPTYMADLIDTHAVTTLHFVPSMLRAYLDHPQVAAVDSVRRVICSGEALAPDLPATGRTAFPRAGFFNLYGPTEAAVDVTWWACDAETDTLGVPIGRPIANLQVHLFDQRLQLVARGVAGELGIGGIGLARGYHGRPSLTAERFVPDPFGGRGARLYRTGDSCRWRSDGAVDYLGRLDHQVKVRGFRIELGEIEAALAEFPGVRGAAVMVSTGSSSGAGDHAKLAAYVVASTPPAPSELREFLAERLPSHMIPGLYVTLESMPLTPSGKIDRKALSAVTNEAEPDARVAPSDPVEETLAAIWLEVLGISDVGVHDHFFELGGDSILGIQVIAKAQRRGLTLELRDLLDQPRIADLALKAVRASHQKAETSQEPVTGRVPLSPIQQWFFGRDLPAPHHWNLSLFLGLESEPNPDHLRQALAVVLRQHDALRAQFRREDGGWIQVIAAPDETAPLDVVDCSQVPAGMLEEHIETQAQTVQASLDLGTGPLVRLVLFRLGDRALGDGARATGSDAARLLLVAHHLVVDAVSWQILLADLQLAWQQAAAGDAIELPPKSQSIKSWAEGAGADESLETAMAEVPYWLDPLRNEVCALPVDRPAGSNTEADARSCQIALSRDETAALLQEVPAVYRTRIDDLLLTAVVESFGEWGGQRLLAVDLEGHGRDVGDLSRTVGWLTTLYPVVLDLRTVPEPGAALKAVKEQLRRVPRNGVGYGHLLHLGDDAAVATQLASLPPAQVLFNNLGQVDRALGEASIFVDVPGSGGDPVPPATPRSHQIEIEAKVEQRCLQVEWSYSGARYEEATLRCLADGFLASLRRLVAHCLESEAGGFTPSDFPELALDQGVLDDLYAELTEVVGDPE